MEIFWMRYKVMISSHSSFMLALLTVVQNKPFLLVEMYEYN